MTIKETFTALQQKVKEVINQTKYELPLENLKPESFVKEYPYVPEDIMTPPEKVYLTLPEKIYFMEKEIHRLRCELPTNEKQCFYTRDQTYRLCVYKKELEALKRVAHSRYIV